MARKAIKKTVSAIDAAVAALKAETFGTPAWDAAAEVVYALRRAENAARPQEVFCSVDSGEHPTATFRYV